MIPKKYSRAYVEITNICNKSCSFCHGTSRAPRRMSLEQFRHVISEIRHLTDYVYFHVMGEPTSHPQLPEFIRYASSLGLKCAVTTKGSLLSRLGEDVLDSGVYKVNLSVHSFEDSDESAHEKYLSELSDFADKASARGILTVLRLWNKGHDGGKNDKTLEFFQNRLDGEWKWGSRGARIRHKLHLEYGERFEWPDMNATCYGDSVFCYGLGDHFGILVDGSVIPCCLDSEGNITLGNIFEAPIDTILSSERAEAIREGFKNRIATEELCKRCGYAQRFKSKCKL